MTIENLRKTFDGKPIIEDFSLEVKPGTITCLLGPSGCGKSTLLNIIAGLLDKDSGTVSYAGQEEGSVSYLFQEPRLLPWRTVLENVALPLNGDEDKARLMLQTVGLGDSLDKYPGELSGGMRQRVAIARAFSFPSRLVLMDEPFQSLDTGLRNSLMKVFLDIWEQNKKTVLWVTHDITEACLAADEIVCVSAKPMKIMLQEDLSNLGISRSERTAENTALLQAKIYQMIISLN